MPTRTLPQVVRYSGDDFVMVVDGVEITPHAGEWVDIWPVLSMREVRRCARLIALTQRGLESMTPEELRELEAEVQEVMEITASNILGWTLTDMRTEEPLPPPSAEVLDGLSPDEFAWIVSMFKPKED